MLEGGFIWHRPEGDLESGDLTGEVVTKDDQLAEFRFDGTFDGGEFNGTHAQVRKDGGLRETGTLSLGPPS